MNCSDDGRAKLEGSRFNFHVGTLTPGIRGVNKMYGRLNAPPSAPMLHQGKNAPPSAPMLRQGKSILLQVSCHTFF